MHAQTMPRFGLASSAHCTEPSETESQNFERSFFQEQLDTMLATSLGRAQKCERG